MKRFATLLCLWTMTAHADLICTGQASIDHPWGPPLVSVLIVEITSCDEALTNAVPGRVTIDMGGSPTNYEGPITADGVTEHEEVAPPSGDIASFRLRRVGEDQILLTLKFMNSDREWLGGFPDTTLTCRPLPRD